VCSTIALPQGTLDMLVLRTLQYGPLHGHGIGVAIANLSQDALQIDHGSLYPAFHRLERQDWIQAEWSCPAANRARSITGLPGLGGSTYSSPRPNGIASSR
jgi:PadR family transcriptional regulator, regulatory protein PadR